MSANTKSRPVRFIIHCGPGLEYFTTGAPQAEALANLNKALRVAAQALTPATQFDELAMPEMMVSTSTALLAIAKQFRASLEHPTAVLSVATFSQNIVAELLNILCDADLGETLRICLYQDAATGSYSVHELEGDGHMGPAWPYGVLHPRIDEDALHELNFKAIVGTVTAPAFA